MPGAAAPPKPPAEAFRLVESVETPGALNADGTVDMILIRPCVGRGRGRHLYEADMLERNAGVFAGWKMFANHQSPAARRALAGLPRPVEELAGRILESRWDSSVPAEGRYGVGAVIGTVKPVGVVKKLIEEDPALLEASIRATATDVRPGEQDGSQVWIVEGIEPTGTVDFVSEGGAGGRIKDLAEAAVRELEQDLTQVFDGLTDDEVAEYLRERRPQLIESAANNGGGDMPLDRTELIEALRDEEDGGVREVVTELIEGAVTERVDRRVSERLEAERDEIRAEVRADADRQIDLRDMQEAAHRRIAASKLPDSWQADLRARFQLAEGRPTDELDQVDEVGEDGEVTKPAMTCLTEAVDAAIEHERTKLAEAAPTRVRGQGPGSGDSDDPNAGGEPGGGDEEQGEKPYHVQFLEEAGVDPEAAYSGAAS